MLNGGGKRKTLNDRFCAIYNLLSTVRKSYPQFSLRHQHFLVRTKTAKKATIFYNSAYNAYLTRILRRFLA